MSGEPEIVEVPDPAQVAAERLAATAAAGGHMALSGGSTPRAAYERASRLAGNWAGATLWFGDERCVPPDDERSNYRMAKEALLDRLTGPVPDVRRIEGERPPYDAADAYEQALREQFGGGVPELDLILMGLGPDAHTASLFPDQPALDARERLAVSVDKPGMEPLVPRVTLTLPVFCAGREVVFLISGEEKAQAVRRSFSEPPGPEAPASLVRPEHGRLTVLVDSAAASALPS